MDDFQAVRAELERLRVLCDKARKCQTLSPADLRGKYKRSYEALHEDVVAQANMCLLECLEGLKYHESVSEGVSVGMKRLTDSPEYQGRREAATRWCWDGDYEALMEFYRWFRGRCREIVLACAGTVDEGSDELWT